MHTSDIITIAKILSTSITSKNVLVSICWVLFLFLGLFVVVVVFVRIQHEIYPLNICYSTQYHIINCKHPVAQVFRTYLHKKNFILIAKQIPIYLIAHSYHLENFYKPRCTTYYHLPIKLECGECQAPVFFENPQVTLTPRQSKVWELPLLSN